MRARNGGFVLSVSSHFSSPLSPFCTLFLSRSSARLLSFLIPPSSLRLHPCFQHSLLSLLFLVLSKLAPEIPAGSLRRINTRCKTQRATTCRFARAATPRLEGKRVDDSRARLFPVAVENSFERQPPWVYLCLYAIRLRVCTLQSKEGCCIDVSRPAR